MIRRWVAYVIGITLVGIGVGFIIGADVGLGAWDIYFVNIVEASKSNFSIVQSLNAVMLVTISYIIRRKFPDKFVILIILNAMYIGFVVDITLNLFKVPESYLFGYIKLFLGITTVAVGVNISRVTKIILPALDFFTESIHLKTGITYGRVKQMVEFVVIIIGVIIGFIFDLPIRLGIGTIIILIFGGLFVNFFFEPIKSLLNKIEINP